MANTATVAALLACIAFQSLHMAHGQPGFQRINDLATKPYLVVSSGSKAGKCLYVGPNIPRVGQSLAFGPCGSAALRFDLTPDMQLRLKGTKLCVTLQQAIPAAMLPPAVFLTTCATDRTSPYREGQRWSLRMGSLASDIPNPMQPAGYCLGPDFFSAASNQVNPVACGDGRDLKWTLSATPGATTAATKIATKPVATPAVKPKAVAQPAVRTVLPLTGTQLRMTP